MITRHKIVFVPVPEPINDTSLLHLEHALDLIAAGGWDTFAAIQGTGTNDELGFLFMMRRQEAVN